MHLAPTSSWQDMVRGSRAVQCLVMAIICSLSICTASYNYDLSRSAEHNAYNYNFNTNKTPLSQRPIQTQKPRALASITLPMAQTQHNLLQEIDNDSELPFSPHYNLLDLHTPSMMLMEQAACRACLSAATPDFCALHAVFRI